MSLQKTEFGAFGLKTGDDMLDKLNEVIEYPRYRFASDDLDFIKGYEHSDLYIALNLRTLDESAAFDLLFESVPPGRQEQPYKSADHIDVTEGSSSIQSDETLVFIGVSSLVECPEHVIPSSVRLVRAKDRVNFFRDILRPSFDLVLKLGDAIREGEAGGLQPASASALCESVSGAVEGTAKVSNGVMGAISEGINRDWIFDSNFQKFVIGSLGVRIEKRGLLVSIPENAEFPFKLGGVFLCALNLPS